MDLKVKDVADLLNVSEKTIRRWLLAGKIPAYRLNQQYRFSRSEIENWMMGFKQASPTKEGFSPFVEQQTSAHEGSQQKGGPQQFSLYRAVHNGGILFDVEGESKEDVIRNAMRTIAPRLNLDHEVISDLLLDRERLMPTGFGHGIGVPHARDFLLQQPIDKVVVAFPKKPLEYGSLDGLPVHTLFFLFSSNDKRHLHLLSKLAHFSSNEKALELVRARPPEIVLLNFIKNWESQLRTL
ncbi:MAG: PTS sugar transporter subunit IIA [Chlamydiales bacterium]|nr:PTS sugar transporter subunit IIA [Chlamydiales bacterium]